MTESTTTSAQPRNGLGTAGLVLGIIAVVLAFIPFVGVVSFVLGPLAVIFGAIGWTRTRGAQPAANNPVASLFGAGLGAVAIAIAIAWTAALGSAAQQVDRELGVGNTAPGDGQPAQNPASGDVVVSQCEITDDFGKFAEASVTITNHTDETQNYMATISVDDQAGDRVGEVNVVSNALAAGQSVTMEGMQATGNVNPEAQVGPADCTVASVDRYPNS